MIVSALLQACIAWAYGHAIEYILHRWLLHKWGAKRGRILSFHFHGHHRSARLNGFYDQAYEGFPLRLNAALKEIISLLFLLVLHLPVLWFFPWAFLVLFLSMCRYYQVHKKSHKNPQWARENLPWHYQHHMLLNQNKNFGVRSDFIDKIAGTRQYSN